MPNTQAISMSSTLVANQVRISAAETGRTHSLMGIYHNMIIRSTVFEFKALTAEETLPAVLRALDIVRSRSPLPLTWEEEVPGLIAAGCGGDVRKAVNAVELLDRAARPVDGGLRITAADAAQASQRSAMRYDREGDEHLHSLCRKASFQGDTVSRHRRLQRGQPPQGVRNQLQP